MVVDASVFIRAGGSAMMGLVGIVALVLARKHKPALALGGFLTCWGVGLAGNNLIGNNPSLGLYWKPVYILLLIGRDAGIAALLLLWPRPFDTHEKWIRTVGLGTAAIVGIATGILSFIHPSVRELVSPLISGRTVPDAFGPLLVLENALYAFETGLYLAFGMVLALRYASSGPDDRLFRCQLAVGVVLILYLSQGANLVNETRLVGFIADGGAFGRIAPFVWALLWLRATKHPDGRPALYAALVILAVLLLGASLQTFAPGRPVNVAVGIQRTVAAFVIAFGIFRLGFLGYQPQVTLARRGTMAAAAMALLFIVAQIMQNFFEARNSLVMGSVLAGAFLFAASPVQRAIERASHRQPTQASPWKADLEAAKRREDVYVNAVRIAVQDRVLTRTEEIHLHHLAEELGIGAGRAHELLVAAEDERKPRGRGRA